MRRDPAAAKTIQEVAFAAFAAHDLPAGADPVLLAEATFDPETFSYPAGTHLCAAEVDTQTGRVTIRSYVAVDDVGKAVNPMIVEGQIHGGVPQGLAQALYEEAVYDGQGNLVTGSLVDYLVPSAAGRRQPTPSVAGPVAKRFAPVLAGMVLRAAGRRTVRRPPQGRDRHSPAAAAPAPAAGRPNDVIPGSMPAAGLRGHPQAASPSSAATCRGRRRGELLDVDVQAHCFELGR